MKTIIALLLSSSAAFAADLTLPVKAPVLPKVACNLQTCTGFFFGGNIANAGGNLDVLGTGLTGLAQNGFGIGVQAGYEFYNGQWYAALLADVDYDASLNAGANAIPVAFKDRLTYGVKARLGYSLAQAFGASVTGTATPTLPQQFLSSLMTPYAVIGEEWRHGQPSLVSGAGAEFLLATNITATAEYLRYTYGQGGTSGTVAGLPTQQTGENEFRLSLNRHF